MEAAAKPDSDDSRFSDLVFNDQGLVVAIAQDFISGDVRMVAWMNREALETTLTSGQATFFSRSRGRLWTKGETSGNVLIVREIYADCDGDALLLRVLPKGPSCHTGRPTCFFRRLTEPQSGDASQPSPTFLDSLEAEILSRQGATSERSYTRYLLDGGASKIGEKVTEEAGEFVEAIGSQSAERVASEAADVVYHLMVGLRLRGVSWRQVIEVLAKRSGQSGHEEKANRSAPSG